MTRFLKRREHLPFSVVGWLTDGADDGFNVATSHLASDMFPIFRTRSRHNVVLCGVVVMVTVNENMEWRADRRYPVRPGHYRIPRWSTVALQAPHWVQSMERPCTWPCSARSQTDRLPHKWSIRLRAGDHNGRCVYDIFAAPGLHFRWGFCIAAFRRVLARIFAKTPLHQPKRGGLQMEVFYTTPTRLASILDGFGRRIPPQGCCTSARPP
jgi:hypothetical protein